MVILNSINTYVLAEYKEIEHSNQICDRIKLINTYINDRFLINLLAKLIKWNKSSELNLEF